MAAFIFSAGLISGFVEAVFFFTLLAPVADLEPVFFVKLLAGFLKIAFIGYMSLAAGLEHPEPPLMFDNDHRLL